MGINLGGLAAVGTGIAGARENQRKIEQENQDDYTRNRTFKRQQEADRINDGVQSPLDMVSGTPAAAGGDGGAGTTGGVRPIQSIGLDMAGASPTPTTAAPAQPSTQQPTDPYIAEQGKVLKDIEAKRAEALKAGRNDLWDTYGQQANSVRNGMIQKLAQKGLQEYGLSKDLKALLPAASLVQDGAEFTDVQKGADGTITVQRTQFGKPTQPLVFKSDQEAIQALKDYTDPASASARAKQFSDMMLDVTKKNLEARGAADAKNYEPRDLAPSHTLVRPGQPNVTAPAATKFSTVANPGEHGGQSLFDESTGRMVSGPGDGAGSGGGRTQMPSYARLFPGSKNIEKDVQEITGKMIPDGGFVAADGKTQIPAEQARLEFQSNLARLAGSNPNLTDLPTVAKTARAITLQQYGSDVPGYSKPTVARDLNTGRMQAEMQTPEGRVVLPTELSKATPKQLIQADENWMHKVMSTKVVNKVQQILQDPQTKAFLTQALRDPQAQEQFEQQSGIPIELVRTFAGWQAAQGKDIGYPAQADAKFSPYVDAVRQFSQSNKGSAAPKITKKPAAPTTGPGRPFNASLSLDTGEPASPAEKPKPGPYGLGLL